MNNRKFVTTVILIGVLNLAAVSLFCFLASRINLKKDNVSNIKKELFLLENRIRNTKQSEALMVENEEIYSEMKSVFLKKENLIVFVEELELLAKKAGVDLKIKSIEVPAGDYSVNPKVSIILEGSFSGVYEYLVLLENDAYQTDIKKFSFQKSSKFETGSKENKSKAGDWIAGLELVFLNYNAR